MGLSTQTISQLVQDAYQLISANSPTIPLQGNDMTKGVQFLNELLLDYSSTGLLLTVAKYFTYSVAINQPFITIGSADYVPTPNMPVGRLANLENAWLNLEGVDYPLIIENRNVFLQSYKYFPQQGLPRFAIVFNDTNLTTVQLYPAPSQVYDVKFYGKFELGPFIQSDDTSALPAYYIRYLKLALARDLAYYKGRASAWDAKLEIMYEEARMKMESTSTVNLLIDSSNESYLNGSWRVMAGI